MRRNINEEGEVSPRNAPAIVGREVPALSHTNWRFTKRIFARCITSQPGLCYSL
jgi:hypothetical protein